MIAATSLPENPYIAGNPVGGGPAFVGRAEVLRTVQGMLSSAQHHAVVLYGQRRIGKTSILLHLVESLEKQGTFRPVYFDLQDKARLPLAEVIVNLAHAIADALRLPSPVPSPEPETWFRTHWLPSVLKGLPNGASLVILFDEFDVLADIRADHAAAAFFPYFRRLLAEGRGRVRFVFVIGRNMDDLASIAKSLFKGLPAQRVSLLLRADAEALIRMSETNGSLAWEKAAIDEAWALTNGHPFLLQQLCWQVWDRLHESRSSVSHATVADITDSVPRTLEIARNALGWLWDGLSPAGRVVASALAGAGNRAISQEELEHLLHESGVRVVIRELRDAPQLLEDWDLIEPTEGAYRFRVELLRQWIAKSKPLSRVQRELDFVQPRAETLYYLGELDFKEGKLDAAAAQLREALRTNPNHARASELLADILISGHQWAEARQLLEQLYVNFPGQARARLAQVLWELAREATVAEDDRLALLERVLELHRKHPGAEAARRQIWRDRGDRARLAGRFEAAIEAYRAAGIEDLEKQVRDELQRRELEELMQGAKLLEERGAYAEAYEKLHTLAQRRPEAREWSDDLARLERLTQLEAAHKRAEDAVVAGDRNGAVLALVDLIRHDPAYRSATARLHALVTGVDVDAELAHERSAHVETRRKQVNTDAALALEVQAKAIAEAEVRNLSEAVQARDTRIQALERTVARQKRETAEYENKHRIAEKKYSEAVAAGEAANGTLAQLESSLSQQREVQSLKVSQLMENANAQRRLAVFATLLAVPSLALAALIASDRTQVIYERNSIRTDLDDKSRALDNERRALDDERRAHNHLRSTITQDGALQIISIDVQAHTKGEDGKCSSKLSSEFPARGTCYVEFQLTLRNNLAGMRPPKGVLCVKYIRPDNGVMRSKDGVGPFQGGTPCSFGVAMNVPVTNNERYMGVNVETEQFRLQELWGNEEGTPYINQPGDYRIEFWWQEEKIGEKKFVIVAEPSP